MSIIKPVNFRDLGGLETTDGHKVQPCRLLRCGEVCELLPEEKNRLVNDYRLEHIVDLRNQRETDERPDDIIDGVAYTHLDILYQLFKMAPTHANFSSISSVDQVHSFMADIYSSMMRDASALSGYRKFLDILLNQRDGAVLFHCFAGKDRTGIAAVIILTILGVEREIIVADYLETNRLRKAANQAMLEHAKSEGKGGDELDALEAGMSVDRRYLEVVFSIAENESGSLLAYLKEHLSVTERQISQLREMYL